MIESNFYKAVSNVGQSVLSGYLGLNVSALQERVQLTPIIFSEVSVTIQMLGEIEAQVICTMDYKMATQIVGRMFGGMEVTEMDEMGWSAIQEFGNWFVSGIATDFSTRGVNVDITHPIVNEGGKSHIREEQQFYVVPLLNDFGMINIYSSIERKTR